MQRQPFKLTVYFSLCLHQFVPDERTTMSCICCYDTQRSHCTAKVRK